MKQNLPIDPYLEQIAGLLMRSSNVLIKASPGSGKTTRLPWFIAKNSTSKVLVLEPRRIAAKLAAERIAQEEGFRSGEEVGYHFRFEKNFKEATRLLFYTEGTFLRKVLQDKDLKDVGTVILDEFHERHLETDMALAYLLGLQKRRPELKLVLMSATLDTEITKQLPHSEVISIEAPNFPVAIHYLPNVPSVLNQALETKIRQALEKADPKGDVLIFLPGMREILKVKDYLGERFGKVFVLHSEIAKEEQEQALKAQSTRKIILSTNIAESSVTIPGITVVIDSGIQREAQYSPWNGLKIISDRPVTQASAIQRAGRAGRTAPGECHRLYSQHDFNSREAFTEAEINRADLTDAYLLSAELSSPLEWTTPPPPERWKKAHDLCFLMGMVDEKEQLTPLAGKAARYPLDLRLSRVLVAGEKLNRDQKKKLLNYICQEIENDPFGTLFRRLSFYLELPGAENFSWEKCLVAGFIDQVAKYRSKQNDFIHFSGKSIRPHQSQKQLSEGYYLILEITQRQEAIKVLPIEEEWIFEHEPFPFTEERELSVENGLTSRTMTKLGSIVIDERQERLQWSELSESQKSRILELSTRAFSKQWEQWKETETFNRFFYYLKISNLEFKETVSLEGFLDYAGELNWDLIENYFLHALEVPNLDNLLPLSINLGGKRDLRIHYPYNLDPFVEAPIQDFYGLKDTPKIAQNKIPLTLKLLGPHKMPLQVTKDLNSFWKKTFLEMKKELQREYPRHHWPDDPSTAPPILLKRQLKPG